MSRAFDQLKVELCDWWGKDRDVAHAAWASTYDAEKLAQKSDDDVRRVVTDIVTLDHGTPKERAWMDFFITCPIYIERQFDKYRMTVQYQGIDIEFFLAQMGRENITQNELSGRYRTIPDRPYVLPDDVARIVSNAVYSYAGDDVVYLPQDAVADLRYELERQHAWYKKQLDILKYARDVAKSITPAEFKRAREVLRGVLGTAFLTDMRILCNAHAFEWIVSQRIEPAAQLESRVLAGRMVLAAKKNEGLATMVDQMIVANDWQQYLDELAPVL
jgi:thymidylate synthase ThyX